MEQFLRELNSVFAYSLAQALISSFLSVAIGLFGAFGVIGLRQGWQRQIGEMLLLLPGLFPALFIILSTLNLIMPWTKFPFGIEGVEIAHVLANFGVVAVVLGRALESKLGGVIEIAAVEGASKARTVWQCMRGLSAESTALFFFLFVVCFTSFSVPLVLGARTGATIEVLIYREMLKHAALLHAALLAIIEAAFVFCFSMMLRIGFSQDRPQPRFLRRVFLPQAMYLTLLVSVLIVAGSFHGLPAGVKMLMSSADLRADLFGRFLGSLFECAAVSVLTGAFFVAIFFLARRTFFDTILAGYIAPSLVLTGFVIYLLVPVEQLSTVARLAIISFGFAFLILPSLYRLRGRSMVKSLEGQLDIARIEGAGHWLVFRKVVWPQRIHDFMWICGIAALWASGDFAFATLLSGHDITLALTAQTLMGGYRLELATVVTWLSLLTGGAIFLLCRQLGQFFESETA